MAKILAADLRRVGAGLALVLLAPALSACNDDIAGLTQRPAFVRTEIVRPRVRQTLRRGDVKTAGRRALIEQADRRGSNS